VTPDEEPIAAEIGSGNIFADLCLPDAEERLLKSQLVVVLHRLIKARKLIERAAAKLLGVSQPDLSHILRGEFDGWSIERLMRMLTAFEQDVDIVVRQHEKAGEAGRITFNVA
jgi:predicted XRE-type DNA-binding protein